MKLRVVEEIRIGFDLYFFDRIYRIDRIFFAYGEWLSAEGRTILTIRLILSNILKDKNPFLSFFFDLTGRFLGRRLG